VEDLDRQVLALLAEDLLLLLLEDLPGTVVRVDDLVTDLVIDVRRLALDIEVLDALVPIWLAYGALPSFRCVTFASSGPRG
jgi:hypothetical protein